MSDPPLGLRTNIFDVSISLLLTDDFKKLVSIPDSLSTEGSDKCQSLLNSKATFLPTFSFPSKRLLTSYSISGWNYSGSLETNLISLLTETNNLAGKPD